MFPPLFFNASLFVRLLLSAHLLLTNERTNGMSEESQAYAENNTTEAAQAEKREREIRAFNARSANGLVPRRQRVLPTN